MQAKTHAAQARALTAGLPEALHGQAAVMAVTSGARMPDGVQVAHTCTDLPKHARGKFYLQPAQCHCGDIYDRA